MRELSVIDWRTVQIFLSEDGVHEVQLDVDDNRNQKCTCVRFSKFKRCKHTKWVENAIMEMGGHFSVQIGSEIDLDEAEEAFESPEHFRQFILKHGRVEVI